MLPSVRALLRLIPAGMTVMSAPCFLPMAATVFYLTSAPSVEASNTRKLLQRAHAGDTSAMRLLARTLWDGTSPKGRGRRLAVAWWKKAADEHHDDRSMVILAELYEKGEYYGKSREKAREYYEKAAEKGNKKAEKKLFQFKKEDAQAGGTADDFYEIARCYEEGRGTEKNAASAEKWYLKAAEKGSHKAQEKLFRQVRRKAEEGDALAMLELAEMYEKGKYTSASDSYALKWYKKAAEAGGFREAKDAVERLEKKPAPAEPAPAPNADAGAKPSQPTGTSSGTNRDSMTDADVRRWLEDETLAYIDADDNMDALFFFAEMKTVVENVTPNVYKAFLNRATNGDVDACAVLTACSFTGTVVRMDLDEGLMWARKAAASGEYTLFQAFAYAACQSMGSREIPQNKREAFNAYQQLAGPNTGNSNMEMRAYTCMAICYETGSGCARQDHEAARYYQKAAEKGGSFASFRLGIFYLLGKGGLPKDRRMAVKYLRQSRSSSAKDLLRKMGE